MSNHTRHKRALFACVFACAAIAGGGAQAQFFELDLTTVRSTYAEGRPQVVPAGTLFSTGGQNRFGQPVSGVLVAGAGNLPAYRAANPGVFLVQGAAGETENLRISIPTIGDAEAVFDSLNEEFDFFSDCRTGPVNIAPAVAPLAMASPVTLTAGFTLGACDRFDGIGRLNGLDATLSSAENSTALRLVIPSVGYDFTTPNTTVRRRESVRLLEDNFFASGKAPMLAAKLLGKPDGFVLPSGELPQEGTLITGEVTVGAVTRTFAIDSPAQVAAYYLVNKDARPSTFGLPYDDDCFRTGAGPLTGLCPAASLKLSVLGVEVTATVPANSTDVTFTAPSLSLSFTSSGAADRDDALGQFFDHAAETVAREDLTRAYARYLAANSPSDPLVGNPFSAQGQLNRASLDLDAPSEGLEESKDSGGGGGGRARPDDPAGWMVGGRVGHLSSAGQSAEFVDAVVERGFRVFEGSRSRLKVSMPLSYIHYGGRAAGGETATFGLRTSLEVPLVQGRWVVEPSAAVSAFYSSDVVSSGALYSVGVSSRYKIAPIGRGHIVIGNAVNYSSTLEIEAGNFATPKISNTAVRNGIAYQLPYGRFLGRQGTVRASYTYTHLFGDAVRVDDYHEVSINYGVASREAAVKQVGETLRFGLNGAFGHDFTAVSLTAGYRF